MADGSVCVVTGSSEEVLPEHDENSDIEAVSQKKDMSGSGKSKFRMMNKLKELHLRRNEARKLNHQEMVEEDQRKKLPANWQARKRKAEWELNDQNARKEAEENGEDYDRVKMLEQSSLEIEKFDKKKKKKNPNEGFSDFATAHFRQYQRLTKQYKPTMEEYEAKQKEAGDDAFPTAHNLQYGGSGEVTEAGIDRMVKDVDKQIETRSKFHRRRQHFDESDVDYINERNMKFNKKAERFYGQYTAEIKQNLERGTAV